MKLEGLDHPKTLDLAARLDVGLPTAVGHLEFLWAFTGKKAPQGNIGKWPNGAIARACYWMGNPDLFVCALQSSGLIDSDAAHRLTVHDWHDHAPGWVRAKLSKAGLPFLSGTSVRSSDATSEASSEPASEGTEVDFSRGSDPPDPPLVTALEGVLSKGSTSTREVRRRAAARLSAVEPFDPKTSTGLNLEAWSLWIEHRTAMRKPIRPHALRDAAEELAALGDRQLAEVKRARAAGWQSLNPEKPNGIHRPVQGNLVEPPRRPQRFPS